MNKKTVEINKHKLSFKIVNTAIHWNYDLNNERHISTNFLRQNLTMASNL
jgi:hypothetical protein